MVQPSSNAQARSRNHERGQTIVIVAFSMFALIAISAIAVDVTTLYVARNEAQQAADAAALAGAKAFVTSGFTSGYVDQATAQTLATTQAVATGTQLKVAGQMLQSSDLTISFPQATQSNPVIKVAVARTGVTTFFARIWGTRSTNLGAIAAAEAFNPSGANSSIQASAVKPFLLPNCKPSSSSGANSNCTDTTQVYFVNPADGSIANGGSYIGQTITLELPNNSEFGGALPQPTTGASPFPGTFAFFPLDIPLNPPTPFCPSSSLAASCNLVGHGPYYDNIACTNPTQLSCGQTVGGATSIPVDSRSTSSTNWSQLKSRVDNGTQCLIHADTAGLNQGQDIFSAPVASGQRILISPGYNNPDQPLRNVDHISRSDSIITVPLFDGSNLCSGSPPNSPCNFTAPIIGFLQLGVTQDVQDLSGTHAFVEAKILNASGCNPSASNQTVTGGSTSSVPVRLVQTF